MVSDGTPHPLVYVAVAGATPGSYPHLLLTLFPKAFPEALVDLLLDPALALAVQKLLDLGPLGLDGVLADTATGDGATEALRDEASPAAEWRLIAVPPAHLGRLEIGRAHV